MLNAGSSAILTYHSIDNSGSAISISPHIFRKHLESLVAARIAIHPLAEIRNATGIALTFDDGFENFRKYALPLLIEHRMPATVFIVSAHCGKHNNWATRPAAVPKLPLMSWDGLREVAAAGCELGAHTVTHPYLTDLSDTVAEREMRDSRDRIEQVTGVAVRSFAYPYGDVNPRIAKIAAAHFDRACGTRLNYLLPDSDNACLARIDAYYLRSPGRMATLLSRPGRRYIALRRWAREARQWFSQ